MPKFIDRTEELRTDWIVLFIIAHQAYSNLWYDPDATRDEKNLPSDVEMEAMRIWNDPNRFEAITIHKMVAQANFDPVSASWGQTTVHEVYHRDDLPS